MFRLITATATVALLAGPVAAADTHTIKEIDVQFDLSAIESAEAADFWADLEGDLEESIATKVVDQLGDEGSVITIDVAEFEMSNTFQGALGKDSTLMAAIEVKNEGDPTHNSYYDLKVTVDESGDFETTEDGVALVTHDREEVYEAVVDTFANGVVKRLK